MRRLAMRRAKMPAGTSLAGQAPRGKHRSIAMAFRNAYMPPLEQEKLAFLKKARETLRTENIRPCRLLMAGIVATRSSLASR
jgi:hypothetical protein